MTREEIKNIVRHVFHFYEANVENYNWIDINEACGEILKVLEHKSVLDKIKAEIMSKSDSIPWRNNDYDDGWIEALEWVIDDVIEKYRTESEEQ